MNYRILIQSGVERQIRAQMQFIAQDSIDRALQWEDELRQRMSTLSDMPRAYAVSPHESFLAGHEVRKLTFGNYLVYYAIDEAEHNINVEGFRHGAQQPES